MLANQPTSLKISCLLLTLVSAPPNDDQLINSSSAMQDSSGSENKAHASDYDVSNRDIAVDANNSHSHSAIDDQSVALGWSRSVLQGYVKHLNLESAYLEVYQHLMRDSCSMCPKVLQMVQPFIEDLCSAGGARGRALARGSDGTSDLVFLYLVDLYVFLITHGFFDARGRVLLRNATSLLHVPREVYFGLEVALAESLHDCEERLARVAAEGGSSQLKRYMKIGAVGLGAGAVIALTGGLAAPAVAAALVVIGGGAAAAVAGVATFAVLASVFGTAGAGLAGYKMARRTKEIDEFVFEQHGKKGQLSVMIMVSGWLQDKEDFKRAFGVVPSNMTLEETVTRFYQTNDPARASNAKSECDQYESNPEILVRKIMERYRKNPLNPQFLCPPYIEYTLNGDQQDLLAECLVKTVLKDAPKSAATGSSASAPSNPDGSAEVKVVSSNKGLLSKSTSKMMKFTTSMFKSTRAPEREQDGVVADDTDEDSLKASVPLLTEASDQVHLVAAKKCTAAAPSKDDSSAEISADHAATAAAAGAVASRKSSSPVPGLPVRAGTATDADAGTVMVAAKTVVRAPEQSKAQNVNTTQATGLEVGNYDNIMSTRYWHWNELDIAPLYELYLLRWETDIQVELGNSIAALMKSLQNAVAEKVVAATVFGVLLGAIALPYQLIKLTSIIDNTWVLGLERADDAGKQLAEVLLNRPQGSRPVTLVGHSIGARLIFSCLQELARRKELEAQERANASGSGGGGWFSFGSKKTRGDSATQSASDGSKAVIERAGEEVLSDAMSPEDLRKEEEQEEVDEWDPVMKRDAGGRDAEGSTELLSPAAASSEETAADGDGSKSGATKKAGAPSTYGIIQDVVLLGLPANASRKAWRRARSVVSGRLINGYSTKDLGLAVLYRWEAKEAISVSGLQSIDDAAAGVENVDLTFMVDKHVDYSLKMKQILAYLDLAASPSSAAPSTATSGDSSANNASAATNVNKSTT